MVTNHEKCVGCHLCVAGCPFNVPRYDKKTNKLAKCTQCADRVPHGLPPLCAKTCPTGAISFGDRDELIRTGEHCSKMERRAETAVCEEVADHHHGGAERHLRG